MREASVIPKWSNHSLKAMLRPVYEKRWIDSPRGKWQKFPWWGDPLKELPGCEDFSIPDRKKAIKSQRLIPSARMRQLPTGEILINGADVRFILGYHNTWRGRGLFYQRLLPAVYVQRETLRLYFRLNDLVATIAALQINAWAGYRERGKTAERRLLAQSDFLNLLVPEGTVTLSDLNFPKGEVLSEGRVGRRGSEFAFPDGLRTTCNPLFNSCAVERLGEQ